MTEQPAAGASGSDFEQAVDAFLQASIRDWDGRAVRMLADAPELARHDFRTAAVLGDAGPVREMLGRDPGLAVRRDERSGWTALHAVCASRWHSLDPARADGLTEVARLLLDAGADPAGQTTGPRGHWTPLRCAVAGAANPAITQLLLERGAVPGDHDLYLACFGGDGLQSLRLLLQHAPDFSGSTALSAPVSAGDSEAARLLLAAGADPNQPLPRDDGDPPWPPLYGAIHSGCPAELADLLLTYGADPDAPGPDGRSPYRLATSLGRADLGAVLLRHHARDDATDAERFVADCLHADDVSARARLARQPGLVAGLSDAELAAIVPAAEAGNAAAVALVLDLGFPADARGEDGATALHVAAYAGSAAVVRLLAARGADIEARDGTWDSTPLEWAMVGSGERPGTSQDRDWVATVQALLDAGAGTEGIALSPDDPKPPSPQVADLLRGHGIGGQ
jgi:ankyrin repeat protein